MKRMAIVNAGVVTDVAVWDGVAVWNPACDALIDITAQPQVSPGWLYDGQNFSQPN